MSGHYSVEGISFAFPLPFLHEAPCLVLVIKELGSVETHSIKTTAVNAEYAYKNKDSIALQFHANLSLS